MRYEVEKVHLADITVSFLLVNNLFFVHYLGMSEFLVHNRFVDTIRHSVALAILLVVGALLFWVCDFFLLRPFHLEFLRTLAAVLVVWITVLIYSGFLGSTQADTAHWPSAKEILLHTVLLGGILLCAIGMNSLVDVMVAALAAAVGYALSLVFLNEVFKRLSRERIPAFIQGLPLQLLTCGLVWLILRGLEFQFSATEPFVLGLGR